MPAVVVTGPTATQNSAFLPSVGWNNHHQFTYPPRMARLSRPEWPRWYTHIRWSTIPVLTSLDVTLTFLMWPTPLPQRQTKIERHATAEKQSTLNRLIFPIFNVALKPVPRIVFYVVCFIFSFTYLKTFRPYRRFCTHIFGFFWEVYFLSGVCER